MYLTETSLIDGHDSMNDPELTSVKERSQRVLDMLKEKRKQERKEEKKQQRKEKKEKEKEKEKKKKKKDKKEKKKKEKKHGDFLDESEKSIPNWWEVSEESEEKPSSQKKKKKKSKSKGKPDSERSLNKKKSKDKKKTMTPKSPKKLDVTEHDITETTAHSSLESSIWSLSAFPFGKTAGEESTVAETEAETEVSSTTHSREQQLPMWWDVAEEVSPTPSMMNQKCLGDEESTSDDDSVSFPIMKKISEDINEESVVAVTDHTRYSNISVPPDMKKINQNEIIEGTTDHTRFSEISFGSFIKKRIEDAGNKNEDENHNSSQTMWWEEPLRDELQEKSLPPSTPSTPSTVRKANLVMHLVSPRSRYDDDSVSVSIDTFMDESFSEDILDDLSNILNCEDDDSEVQFEFEKMALEKKRPESGFPAILPLSEPACNAGDDSICSEEEEAEAKKHLGGVKILNCRPSPTKYPEMNVTNHSEERSNNEPLDGVQMVKSPGGIFSKKAVDSTKFNGVHKFRCSPKQSPKGKLHKSIRSMF